MNISIIIDIGITAISNNTHGSVKIIAIRIFSVRSQDVNIYVQLTIADNIAAFITVATKITAG